MTVINLVPNSLENEFVVQLLQNANKHLYQASFQPDSFHLEIGHPVLARLVARLGQKPTVVLPYRSSEKDYWLIAGTNGRDLETTHSQISRFVLPTYAEFSGEGHYAELKLFNPVTNPLQNAAARLFTAGYYRWESPKKNFNLILQQLELWLNLVERQPVLQNITQPEYRDLYQVFNSSLAGANWDQAAQTLASMRQHNLVTIDNLCFLQVQLWAQQQDWKAIWNWPEYANLARMRLPRNVRAALITAFHANKLLILEQEQQWAEILTTFRANRVQLGWLLTARLGISAPPVVKVFAYQAVADQDQESLKQLLKQVGDEVELVSFIDSLLNTFFPTVVPSNTTTAPSTATTTTSPTQEENPLS